MHSLMWYPETILIFDGHEYFGKNDQMDFVIFRWNITIDIKELFKLSLVLVNSRKKIILGPAFIPPQY